MIDIGVRLTLPFMGVICKMAHYILVYFSLQVYTYGAVASNNFVGTYSRVGRHVAARIRDTHIIRDIRHVVVSPFDGGIDKSSNKILM